MEPLMEIGDDKENQQFDCSENLDYLINVVYRPFIEEKVNAKDIFSRLPSLRPFASKIYSCGDSKLAIQTLLDDLKNVQHPGKYQEFKEALKGAGYENICQALEGRAVKNDFEHTKIMALFSNKIQETIDANKLAQELFSEAVINEEMRQRVITSYQRDSPLDATFILLDSIHRLIPNWFHTFLEVLYRNGHRNLVKDLDDKYLKKLDGSDLGDTEEQGNGPSQNVSQNKENRDDDEDFSSNPSVSTEIDRNRDTESSEVAGSIISERANLAAVTDNLPNVSAMVTLMEKIELLLEVMERMDAKIGGLDGKVDDLEKKMDRWFSTLTVARP